MVSNPSTYKKRSSAAIDRYMSEIGNRSLHELLVTVLILLMKLSEVSTQNYEETDKH